MDDPNERQGKYIVNEQRFLGKTLKEIAAKSDPNFKGFVVFILKDDQDDTGRRVESCFHIRHFLQKHPEMANYKVKIANDYYGETILRVKEVKRMKMRLCFKLTVPDEDGEDFSMGVALTVDGFREDVTYQQAVNAVNKQRLIDSICMTGIVTPEQVVPLTPEEYDAEFTDDPEFGDVSSVICAGMNRQHIPDTPENDDA